MRIGWLIIFYRAKVLNQEVKGEPTLTLSAESLEDTHGTFRNTDAPNQEPELRRGDVCKMLP